MHKENLRVHLHHRYEGTERKRYFGFTAAAIATVVGTALAPIGATTVGALAGAALPTIAAVGSAALWGGAIYAGTKMMTGGGMEAPNYGSLIERQKQAQAEASETARLQAIQRSRNAQSQSTILTSPLGMSDDASVLGVETQALGIA